VNVVRIATRGRARSLFWDGEDLVDVLGGWRRWRPTGEESPSRRRWAYPFDQALISPSGRFHVLYAERATKALVLADGRVVRELNRSFYHACDYDYPVAVGRLPDGREVLVHCPDAYNVLEVEDLESGRRLTDGDRHPSDVFHSRLAISPDGRHVLTAGWLWHPVGVGWVFDLVHSLTDPAALDGRGLLTLYEAVDAEVGSACWLDADRLAVATTAEEPFDGDEPRALGPSEIGVWSLSGQRWLHRCTVESPVGTMIPCDGRVFALYGHPRLLDVTTGAVVAEWPDIDSGRKGGSYGVTHVPTPVTALHPDGSRLAIAQPDHIAVIDIGNRERVIT
jgi:WD40 repeat protein